MKDLQMKLDEQAMRWVCESCNGTGTVGGRDGVTCFECEGRRYKKRLYRPTATVQRRKP